MKYLRPVLFLLTFSLLFMLGCSSGSTPTQPPVNTGQGDGLIDPVGPPPLNEIDPELYPWWDCQRFFIYNGSISSWSNDGPHTIPLIVDGNLRIRDKDCGAKFSKVKIRVMVNDLPDWPRDLPGKKFVFNTGTLYLGRKVIKTTLLGGGVTIIERCILWVYPNPDGSVIKDNLVTGWYHKVRDDWMLVSGGFIIHDYSHQHLDINIGHEIYLIDEDPGS